MLELLAGLRVVDCYNFGFKKEIGNNLKKN